MELFHHKAQQQTLILGAFGKNTFCVLNAKSLVFSKSSPYPNKLGYTVCFKDPLVTDFIARNPIDPFYFSAVGTWSHRNPLCFTGYGIKLAGFFSSFYFSLTLLSHFHRATSYSAYFAPSWYKVLHDSLSPTELKLFIRSYSPQDKRFSLSGKSQLKAFRVLTLHQSAFS